MNGDELRKALAGLSEEQYQTFRKNLGGEDKGRAAFVQDFVYISEFNRSDSERRTLFWLNPHLSNPLKTEDQKRTLAAERAAEAAERSAAEAKRSRRIAIGACAAAAASAIAIWWEALVGYFRGDRATNVQPPRSDALPPDAQGLETPPEK